MPEALQIASLILHCRPERLPAVKANLALLDGLRSTVKARRAS